MLPHRVYLMGELGKFRDSQYVAQMLAAIDPDVLRAAGLIGTAEDLSTRFSTQSSIGSYVANLGRGKAMRLAVALSRWRNNPVHLKAGDGSDWPVTAVPMREVLLSQAESRYAEAWAAHGWELERIASDPALMSLPPYTSYRPGREVEFPILLAELDQGRWRVFDGVHRAIQLYLNGEARLTLCVPPVSR